MLLPHRLFLAAWLAAGVLVARSRGYLDGVDTVPELLQALVAVSFWPLVLAGVALPGT